MARIIVRNNKARFNFALLDQFEAGLQLQGWEVKSIRAKQVHFNNAFCAFKGEELYLSNLHVQPYMDVPGEPDRARKLLLKKSELNKLSDAVKMRGLTIVPLALKWSRTGYVKVDIATARGKTLIDKREVLKARDEARRLQQYHKGM